MKTKEIRDAIFLLKMEKFRLQEEYEENGGEVTEVTLERECAIENLKKILTDGGIDSLGRLIRSAQDDVQAYKNEKRHIDNQIKRTEGFIDFLLELTNEAMKECGIEAKKGNLGYSFKQHISTTTKADNKRIKELFYQKALDAIRSTDIPADITITLSASSSSLPEGAELPEWYSVTSVGRATFRKPRVDKPGEDEFDTNDFTR